MDTTTYKLSQFEKHMRARNDLQAFKKIGVITQYSEALKTGFVRDKDGNEFLFHNFAIESKPEKRIQAGMVVLFKNWTFGEDIKRAYGLVIKNYMV